MFVNDILIFVKLGGAPGGAPGGGPLGGTPGGTPGGDALGGGAPGPRPSTPSRDVELPVQKRSVCNHRLVGMSSLSVPVNDPSLRASGRHSRKASRARWLSLNRR